MFFLAARFAFFAAALLTIPACQQGDITAYRTPKEPAAMLSVPASSAAPAQGHREADWTVPAGWQEQPPAAMEPFDEEQHSDVNATKDPETLLLDAANAELVDDAIRTLPDRFRELLVLRELEGLSYQELADVLDIPLGTVMSGLSRARQAFRRALLLELELRGMQATLASA